MARSDDQVPPATPRRPVSTVTVVLAGLVLGLTAPTATASPDPGDAAAAAQVSAYTDAYRQASAAAAAAAAQLASAYETVAAADADDRAAQGGLSLARARLADQVLALYELGPAADGALSVLTADSPQDGLWQLAVGTPLAERVLGDAATEQQDAGQRATEAAGTDQDALTAADRIDGLLTRLRTAKDAASWALMSAQGELARLRQVASEQVARLAEQRLAAARQVADTTPLPPSTAVGALPIPPEFDRAYHDAAATCPGLSWTLLAAVGQVESGQGRNDGPSSAGAIGPMQFLPATFAAYAVDGDGDGRTDPWDTRDAVFTAAHYLCVSGAGLGPVGVHAALLTYNHAEWYVDLVLAAQAAIAAAGRPGR